MTTQRVDGKELTREVSLTRPDGRLDPDAVGWARRPLVDTSGIGRGRGRTKRWEYWNVTTPSHVAALTVSHIDYAAVHEVWVLDRESHRTWRRSATLVPARGVELPAARGRALARGREGPRDRDRRALVRRRHAARHAAARPDPRGRDRRRRAAPRRPRAARRCRAVGRAALPVHRQGRRPPRARLARARRRTRREPSYVKETRTNLVVLSARTDQAFGQWSGTVADDDVEVAFEGLAGWAEDVHNHW